VAVSNFRKILSGIDVHPLLQQIAANPDLWNYDDSWTRFKPGSVAIYDTDSIVLRYNHPTPRGEAQNWDKPAFGILSCAQKIIFDFMRALPGEHLGKIVITRMQPGEEIREHIDAMPQGWPVYYQRYQIPLSVLPGVVFRCGGEDLYMQPGSAYWFNNQLLHSVVNNSKDPRISMLADIRPFALGPLGDEAR
jgi:hypothetical protein